MLDLRALGALVEAELRAAGRWIDAEPAHGNADQAAHDHLFVRMSAAATRLDAGPRDEAPATSPQRQRAPATARRRRAAKPKASADSDGEPPARRVRLSPIGFGVEVVVEVLVVEVPGAVVS